MTTRRTLLASTAAALVAAPLRPRLLLAAEAVRALELIDSLGEPSAIWTTFALLQPVLQGALACPVAVRTVTGDRGLNAAREVFAATEDTTRLLGISVMGQQFAGRADDYPVRIEDCTPIAKLSDGFSIAMFTRAGGPLASWQDAATAARAAPLKVSCLEKATSSHVTVLMVERLGGLALEVTERHTIGEIIEDVLSGVAAAGFIATNLVARDPANLLALATFGAERNATTVDTPTFAEITGEHHHAFTESVAAVAAPDLDPGIAAALVEALLAAGSDPAIVATQETIVFPIVVGGPDVLVETMERNGRVLDAIMA